MVRAAAPYVGDTGRSPVVACLVGSLVCAFLGIGVIAAYLPAPVPVGWPIGFLAASVALLAAATGLLRLRRRFAWALFFAVARWVFVGTSIFSLMGVYVMVYDGTSRLALNVMIAVLLLSAIDIPLVIAFNVARHEPPS